MQRLTLELDSRVSQRTKSLQMTQDRLRALATQLSLAEERVRRSLATELHDYLGQILVVCRMKLTQASQGPLERREEHLRDADKNLQDAITYTRSLAAQLTPPVLREFGLLMGLTWLAEQMKQHELGVALQLNASSLDLSEEHAILLFQCVRELLMNIVKHSGTKQATLSVEVIEQTLVVTVTDEGRGFDLSTETSTSPGDTHFGLFSIRERMDAVGGRFQLLSFPGQGTSATLRLPMGSSRSSVTPQTDALISPPISPSQNAEAHIARVLMVDDHPMMRQGLRAIVEQFDHCHVIGEAADGQEALALAQQLRPDMVIMDVNMPNMDGIEATRQLLSVFPELIVIGLSVHNSAQVDAEMKLAGAAAYLTKDAAPELLYQAILTALSKRNSSR